jgi:hypothetical protein
VAGCIDLLVSRHGTPTSGSGHDREFLLQAGPPAHVRQADEHQGKEAQVRVQYSTRGEAALFYDCQLVMVRRHAQAACSG